VPLLQKTFVFHNCRKTYETVQHSGNAACFQITLGFLAVILARTVRRNDREADLQVADEDVRNPEMF